ncbi:hypothetical protein C0J52_25235, partial [Blattella germanica]
RGWNIPCRTNIEPKEDKTSIKLRSPEDCICTKKILAHLIQFCLNLFYTRKAYKMFAKSVSYHEENRLIHIQLICFKFWENIVITMLNIRYFVLNIY